MDPTKLGDELATFSEAVIAWALSLLPNAIVALLILAIGWAVAGWAERAVGRLLDRGRIEPTLHGVTTAVVRYGILVLVVVAALGQVGVQTTSILAVLGAIGLAIGLALQGTLANIAAGLMLLWLRPFRVGDFIEAGNVSGTVKDVGLFASELHSGDGVYQFVPNSELWNKRIINYSRLDRRLVDLKFEISYTDDIETACQRLLELAKSDPRVLPDPAPNCVVDKLTGSSVILGLSAWTTTANFGALRTSLIVGGKKALEDAGIYAPLPQRVLHFASELPIRSTVPAQS